MNMVILPFQIIASFQFLLHGVLPQENFDFLNSDSKNLNFSGVISDKFQSGHDRLLVSSQDGPCYHKEDLLSSDTVTPLVARSAGL